MQQLREGRWTQVKNLCKEAKKCIGSCSIIHDHLSYSAVYFNWLQPLSVLHGPQWQQLLLGPEQWLFIGAQPTTGPIQSFSVYINPC